MTNTNRTLTALISSVALIVALAFATPALAASTNVAQPDKVAPAKLQTTMKKDTKKRRTELPRKWVWAKRAKHFDGMFRK